MCGQSWASPVSAHPGSWCVPGHEGPYCAPKPKLGTDHDTVCSFPAAGSVQGVRGSLRAWRRTLPLDAGMVWQFLSAVSCCMQCRSGTQLLMKGWDLLSDRGWSESPLLLAGGDTTLLNEPFSLLICRIRIRPTPHGWTLLSARTALLCMDIKC